MLLTFKHLLYKLHRIKFSRLTYKLFILTSCSVISGANLFSISSSFLLRLQCRTFNIICCLFWSCWVNSDWLFPCLPAGLLTFASMFDIFSTWTIHHSSEDDWVVRIIIFFFFPSHSSSSSVTNWCLNCIYPVSGGLFLLMLFWAPYLGH